MNARRARGDLSPAARHLQESWGAAVNVQAMVFGNMGGKPRLPASPSPQSLHRPKSQLYGGFLMYAQGEDVVAGIRTPPERPD